MIILSKEYLYAHWIKEKKIKVRGKMYRVGKMSYGDWFLETGPEGCETDLHNVSYSRFSFYTILYKN